MRRAGPASRYKTPVRSKKKGRLPTPREVHHIRRFLNMPSNCSFDRCPGKDRKFVKRCEARGDFSHSGSLPIKGKGGHICEICRCKHVAGSLTYGDFYNFGYEEVGHYGVGWCRTCESPGRWRYSMLLAEGHAQAIKKRGLGLPVTELKKYEIERRATNAMMAQEVRDVAEKTQELFSGYYEKLKAEADSQTEIAQGLNRVAEALETTGELSPETSDLIDRALARESLLTQYAQGKLVKMSTETELKLFTQMAKAVASINVDLFKIDSSDMVHIDELDVRVNAMMSQSAILIADAAQEAAEQFRAGRFNQAEFAKKYSERFVEMFYSIFSNPKKGRTKL